MARRSALVLTREVLAGLAPAAPWLARLADTGVEIAVLVEGAGAGEQVLDAWRDAGLGVARLLAADPEGPPRCRLPRPGALLDHCQASGADPFASWLVTTRPAAVTAAAQAGFVGVVVLDGAVEIDHERRDIAIRRARDLADAPRVMVPPEGGCWHDHR